MTDRIWQHIAGGERPDGPDVCHLLTVFVLLLAFVVDVGGWLGTQHRLQTVADATALSAIQLGSTGPVDDGWAISAPQRHTIHGVWATGRRDDYRNTPSLDHLRRCGGNPGVHPNGDGDRRGGAGLHAHEHDSDEGCRGGRRARRPTSPRSSSMSASSCGAVLNAPPGFLSRGLLRLTHGAISTSTPTITLRAFSGSSPRHPAAGTSRTG